MESAANHVEDAWGIRATCSQRSAPPTHFGSFESRILIYLWSKMEAEF